MHDHDAGGQPVVLAQWWGIWRLAAGITCGKTPPSKCGNDEADQVADNEPKQRAKPPAETGHVADMSPGDRQVSNHTSRACNASVVKGMLGSSAGTKATQCCNKACVKDVPTISLV